MLKLKMTNNIYENSPHVFRSRKPEDGDKKALLAGNKMQEDEKYKLKTQRRRSKGTKFF